MYNSMNNTYQRSKRSAASNAISRDQKAPATGDEEFQDFAANDYDSNNDDDAGDDDAGDDDAGDDDDVDEFDQFSPHQRMPTQHPATRTCFQLLGRFICSALTSQ